MALPASSFRRLIILSSSIDALGTQISFLFVHWLVAPAGLVVPLPGFVSQVPLQASAPAGSIWSTTPPSGSTSAGLTSTELTGLQLGTIVEAPDAISMPVSLLGTTQSAAAAVLETTLVARYTAQQNALTARSLGTAIASTDVVGAFVASNGTSWTFPAS